MTTIEKTKEKRDAYTIVDEAKSKIINIGEQAEKSRKDVIIETARELENNGMIPLFKICSFMTKEFKGILKPRTISEYLDEKYKIKTREANAKKQKKKQSSLAAKLPLNQEGAFEKQYAISVQEKQDMQSVQAKDISIIDDGTIGSLQDFLQLSQQQQQNDELEKQAVKKPEEKSKIQKTIERLYEENSEQEEIIKKYNHFTSANNITKFEETISVGELIEYIKSNGLKNADGQIHFRIELDKTTVRVLSFGLAK